MLWLISVDAVHIIPHTSLCRLDSWLHLQPVKFTATGVRSFGRQDVWATDVWATNFFPNVHLGDTKLDVWATRTRRLGDKSKSLNLGQPHRPGSCTRSLAVIICFSTYFSKVHRRFNNTDRQRLKRL